MIQISEILILLDELAPFSLQESYDNCGLQAGHREWEVTNCLVSLDITEEVVREAISKKCRLIVSHHPLIFAPVKSLTGETAVERCLELVLKNNIAVIAMHTNLDNASAGLNSYLCEKLGLRPGGMLEPRRGMLRKLVTFCPPEFADKVRQAIFNAGAGHIGNYDQCSYNTQGLGSFRAGEKTDPFVGKKGELHFEQETRIETVFPDYLGPSIISSMLSAHPYEEVAYDIYLLENEYSLAGAGILGYFDEAVEEAAFLRRVKELLDIPVIRHSRLRSLPVRKVAICGGSGSFLIHKAIASGADMFLTADLKYHHYFEADGKIVLADIGHFESEQFAMELLAGYLKKKIPNFAVLISGVNTNPICYY